MTGLRKRASLPDTLIILRGKTTDNFLFLHPDPKMLLNEIDRCE